MATRKTVMLACDNPKCDAEFEHTKSDPAPGYHFGRGIWVFGGGGPIPPFYACSEKCVVPALLHMVEFHS